MNEVSVNIHPYDDHLHLEVITDAGGGNVTAQSFEFDTVDRDRAAVTPREQMPQSHEEEIRAKLEAAGYDLLQRHPA
jgi:hypothetical protein